MSNLSDDVVLYYGSKEGFRIPMLGRTTHPDTVKQVERLMEWGHLKLDTPRCKGAVKWYVTTVRGSFYNLCLKFKWRIENGKSVYKELEKINQMLVDYPETMEYITPDELEEMQTIAKNKNLIQH